MFKGFGWYLTKRSHDPLFTHKKMKIHLKFKCRCKKTNDVRKNIEHSQRSKKPLDKNFSNRLILKSSFKYFNYLWLCLDKAKVEQKGHGSIFDYFLLSWSPKQIRKNKTFSYSSEGIVLGEAKFSWWWIKIVELFGCHLEQSSHFWLLD